jgi:hypothetical protein
MRATSVIGFVLFGAIGYGIGGIIGILLVVYLPGMVAYLLGPLVGGAVGGVSLGLASKDFRRVVILGVLGALGLTVGVTAGLGLGSFFNYGWLTVAIVGAVVGALLGVAFRDWRMVLALAVAGAVGFVVGNLLADFIRFSIPILRQVGEAGGIAFTGIIGGAFLGAALGYLENRRLAERRRPRVRWTSVRLGGASAYVLGGLPYWF